MQATNITKLNINFSKFQLKASIISHFANGVIMSKIIINALFIKYLLVGLINTVIGFGIIFIMMFCGFSPEVSNLVGYVVGIFVSYILNKYFTFKQRKKSKKEFFKFTLSMLIAYSLNLLTLLICYRILNIDKYLSQIIAGVIYTLSGFILSKFYVFK